MFSFRKKKKDEADEVQPAIALITEDEPILRMDVTAMLEGMGFSVVGVETAEKALGALASKQVELLITDIHMPGKLDGLALAKQAASQWPELRIVICSGRTTLVDSDLPAGVKFVQKPYTLEDIEDAILSF